MPERERSSQHFEELEAYRGVAALLIVVFHAYQYTRQATQQSVYLYEGTWRHHLFANFEAGVAWFFALSGFLLFLPIARSCIEQTGRQSTRAFLIRRAIRIIPLYFFAIITVWCWRYTGGPGQWRDLFYHLTFTHIFSDRYLFWTIGPAWSLAVEVHFYIALAIAAPVIYAFCHLLPRSGIRIGALLLITIGLWVAGVRYNWWLEHVAHISHARSSMYFSLPAKIDNFASGMFLAVIVAALKGRMRIAWPTAWFLRFGGISVIGLSFAARDYSSFPGPPEWIDTWFHSISAVAFTVIVASTVLGPRDSPWTRFLARPWLQMLGLLSYSVYMWHEPLLVELGQRENLIHSAPNAFRSNTVILITLSISIAWVTYRAIERPTMELRHLYGPTGRLVRRYLPLNRGSNVSSVPTSSGISGSD